MASYIVMLGVPLIILVFAYLIYDKYWLSKKGKKIKVFLFDKFNGVKKFKKSFIAEIAYDKKLGHYLRGIADFRVAMPSKENIIAGTDNMDCVFYCKFAEDDYRVMAFLNTDFFREVELPVWEEVQMTNEEDEQVLEFIQKTNNEGELLFEIKTETYVEPVSIDQTGREVMRFNRDFKIRMAELRKVKDGWWDKYGAMALNLVIIVFAISAIMYINNKSIERDMYWADKFDDNAKSLLAEIKAPSFLGRVEGYILGSDAEANAPQGTMSSEEIG